MGVPPVSLFSGLALKQVLDDAILPAFTTEFNHEVKGTYEPTKVLMEMVGEGSRPEVMIGVDSSLHEAAIAPERALHGYSITPLVRSGLGLAVPLGVAEPDISDRDEFVRTLLGADRVAYSRTGASGIYFAKLIEQLGIAAEINQTAVVVKKGLVAETLLGGQADLAVQQLVELAMVPDIKVLGPFPPQVQSYVELSVGLSPTASQSAQTLLEFLFSETATDAYRSVGLEPIGETK